MLPSPLLPLLALLASPGARAEGLSVDVELLRPTFSPGPIPGVETPVLSGQGAMRYGLVYQYQRDPVILWEFNEEAGSVVRNRRSVHLGYAYDINDRFSVRAVLPVAWHSGFDEAVSDLSFTGAGLGDLELGGRARLAQAGPLSTGIRGDIALPIGTDHAYMGEPGVRVRIGAMGLARFGPFSVALDGSFMSRQERDSNLDYKMESTIDLNLGGSVDLWPDKVAISTAFLSRSGSSSIGTPGGENASEWIGGLQLHPFTDGSQIDLGVGKGLTQGVGSSAFRWYLAYTWVRPPKVPPPEPQPVYEPPPPPPEPDIPPEFEEPEPEVLVFEEEEKAKVFKDEIVIRDPIQFEFNTDQIKPESIPTLHAVAEILNDHAEIAHIVIEGHASEEGSYEYNYDLSNLRARAIWKELIRAGVHPSRMSYRGMGEVVPEQMGEDEASLAANRRVEFHIVERLNPDDEFPEYPETTALPWNGEVIHTIQPKRPEPPPEETQEEEKSVEEQLEELLNPDNFSIDQESPDGEGAKEPAEGESGETP
ncbi:MAG: OmpA family protein [Alphaproteobacteria bacterium]|nr:OmpA family protein [Alphaproteobacteria bacterium]